MSWTTPLAEVAPALARLGTPLRWLRLPVDEWAASIALSIRCLPLLILSSADYGEYHDTEWGFPVADDDALFEKLCLEHPAEEEV